MSRSVVRAWRGFAWPAALLLCGCGASSPTRYYTLFDTAGLFDTAQPSDAAGRGRIPTRTATFVIDVQPVAIPAQVDQPQLVVRDGDANMRLLEHERWIAPLADEVRGALALMLSEQLVAPDAAAAHASAAGMPVLKVKLDVQRFDSVPGEYAEITATWSLRYGTRPQLVCAAHERQDVGQGYDELVRGQRRALGHIAGQMAAAARRLDAGAPAACPDDG